MESVQLKTLFSPESIAVIGASSDGTRIAGLPVTYLRKHGYRGEIHPVNPNHDEIQGLQCYSEVGEIPDPPDLAMILLPARLVNDVAKECVDAGVETVLVVSSGFSETGDSEGIDAEQELSELVADGETALIGPNSQGIVNFPEKVTASFTPALQRDDLVTGGVSFVSQSGAFGGALTTLLQEEAVGLNKWVATGNEAALESLDFIHLMAEDESTNLVAGYLEGFEDGRKLIELKRTTRGIDLPIVVMKSGRSKRAREAASSHTGKIAGRHAVYESIFAETGVISVDDIDLFVDVISAICRLDSDPGPRLGIMTTSGGGGIHLADIAAEENGVTLDELSPETQEELDEFVPNFGATGNPVDITAEVINSTNAFRKCLRILLRTDEVDTVVLQLTNASGDEAVEYAESVAAIATETDTPLFVVWTGGLNKEAALSVYEEAGIPVFENPARCVQSIAAISRSVSARDRLRGSIDLPATPPNPDPSRDSHPSILTEFSAKSLLSQHGIETPAEQLATSLEMAVTAATEIDFPVVAKLVSPDVHHRNAIDGIRLGLDSKSAVETAYRDLRALAEERTIDIDGILIQEEIQGGLELASGIVTDTDFGPVIMLGSGGVDIESVKDVTFRTIPISVSQADSMLDELETVSSEQFTEVQKEALIDTLVSLSEVYMENPWIREADLNPLILSADGVTAVDALVFGRDEL